MDGYIRWIFETDGYINNYTDGYATVGPNNFLQDGYFYHIIRGTTTITTCVAFSFNKPAKAILRPAPLQPSLSLAQVGDIVRLII